MAVRRKGKAVNLTLEHESVEILHALCPNQRGYGLLLSSLLRQEEQRRHEARQLREWLVALAQAEATP